MVNNAGVIRARVGAPCYTLSMSLTRDSLVRAIASALVFSDPPAMANLTKARAAAGQIVDALADIGAIDRDLAAAGAPAELVNSNGHALVDADQGELPI